jgi:hypothetical protein
MSELSTPVTLHSDGAQSHETVALTPRSTVPLTLPNRLNNPPSHRRTNTEYIARPPLFEEELGDTISDRPKNTPWTETFPKKKLEARARVLSDWFQGKSDPVNLGPKMGPNGSDGAGVDARQAFVSHTRQHSTPVTNRFSFFGLRRQPSKPNFPEPADDEFLNLDITAALSLPEPDDDANEEALDALREHADKVLRRMQDAYKQRTFAMYQAVIDKNEKQDELEETRSRVDHLKMQLDGMAAKVLDQEKAMQAMAEELEQEKQTRRTEESRSRSRTVRSIPADDDVPSMALQTPRRGGKRASHSTFTSDSGFESGDESIADSVFSHREGLESPTSTLAGPSPNISQIALSTPTGPTPTPTIQKNLVAVTNGLAPARSSAYDRVLKGLASTRLGSSFAGTNASKCNNCYGVPASEAWSVMGVLKEENRGLKTRLGELEIVIDDCLGLVGS